MIKTDVSVIVVSNGRPEALMICLTAVSQLRYPAFEIIVVADRAGLAAVQNAQLGGAVKPVPFDDPNISTARNLGIAAAAGDVVAFIDDDAVPEPSWLTHLVAPFSQTDVAASGGFVRGRNGISHQWTAQSIGEDGICKVLNVDPDLPTVLMPVPGIAIKTQGTNMAFRRSVLADIGGFDPNFHYFHDETDLNMRLALAGYRTAIVPLAEVHHGFHANASRSAARVPSDLFEIGASWAVYLRKHCPVEQRTNVWLEVQMDQRRRALSHMVAGGLGPDDIGQLIRGLKAGYAEGKDRAISPLPKIKDATEAFRGFSPAGSTITERPAPTKVISGRIWQGGKLRAKACEHVRRGEVVTLMLLSPTALFHTIRFHPDGYWEQRGGLFGKSDRQGRYFQFTTFRRRIMAETNRIRRQRLIGDR